MAARLWCAGATDLVVVSGAGEADFAAAVLGEAGVPSAAIVREGRARTTWENLLFSRPLLGPAEIWLVSDGWHLPRACAMARRLGYRPHPAGVDEEPDSLTHAGVLLRERAATWAAYLRGRVDRRGRGVR